MAALEIAQQVNGEEFYTFRNRVMGKDFPSFIDTFQEGLLANVAARIPEDRIFVIKTHAELSPALAEAISDRTVRAFTSFRDPRDTALSILNAGEADRKIGNDRYFSAFEKMEQLKAPVQRQARRVQPWIDHPDVLAIPYYLTAMSEATSVGLLAEFLGVGHLRSILAAKMAAKRETLPEFNKGILDRFIDELPADDIRFGNEVWAEAIAAYNTTLETVMARLGHRMSHDYFVGLRDRKLSKKLSEA